MAETKYEYAKRQSYNKAKMMLEAGNQFVVNDIPRSLVTKTPNIRMADSFLCSEVQLAPTNNSYDLNMKEGTPNTPAPGATATLFPDEQRLKINDVFFTYALGFYIRPVSPGGGSFVNQLMTFPSAQFFGAGASNLATLVGLWTAGNLKFSIGGEIITPAHDLSNHLYIPQTQEPANPIAGSIFWDQVDLQNDGKYVIEPNWILNGSSDNQTQINYGSNFNSIVLGTLNYRIVLKEFGWLAQNASGIMNNAPSMKQGN